MLAVCTSTRMPLSSRIDSASSSTIMPASIGAARSVPAIYDKIIRAWRRSAAMTAMTPVSPGTRNFAWSGTVAKYAAIKPRMRDLPPRLPQTKLAYLDGFVGQVELDAIAVELLFVKPFVPGRSFIDERRCFAQT